MSELVIYGMAFSNFVRTVRMALFEKGIPYRFEPYVANTPEMLALNPFGKVPAMRHGDLTLFESQAICRYIEDAFGGPSLRPGTLAEKAVVDQWVAATCDHADKAFVRNYVLAYAMPKWLGKEPDRAQIAAAVPGVRKVIGVLDRHMDGREFVAADQLTLADLFLAPTTFLVQLYPEGKEALAEAPHLTRWLNSMMARDSFIATKPPKG
ncbi:glutathione S-transferase family protein [Indioceanicola profundi]|uniref:glutathione S-transferase family protein n=1 Tax=Indioceanicola profundi TaxID=2220096 RepID=UPI000E6A968A|nr:glutathione S-transferase family protein [Indioceanicola profundi]